MSTSVRNKLFFTFILLCFGKCFGEEYCGHIGISSAAPGNIEIIYVNGIDNTSYDACSSSQLVINTLRQTDRYNYDYVYNPTEGSVDKKELSWQAKLSQSALSSFGYDSAAVFADPAKKRNYYSLLGGLYAVAIARGEVGAGSMFKTTLRLKNYIASELARTAKPKLVIVAHSQGNFYIEAAYAMLIREALLKGDADVSDLENRVRVVGVASVATSTPNNRYLSHSMDAAVFTGQEALSVFSRWNYSPLKPNIDACTTSPCSNFASDGSLAALFRVAKLPDDSTNVALHNFRAVYMNSKIYDRSTGDSFPTIITRMINESVTELLSSDQKLNNYANGHSYELITCGTWSQCRAAATAKGGSLVTIRNQAENDWLTTNLLQQAKPDFAVWIGFTDAGHEGNWTWASGEVKPYSNWYPGEPNNSGNVENYAIIYNSGAYKDKWNDVQNDYPYVTKAIVEYSSP